MKVRILAYKGKIIIIPVEPEKDVDVTKVEGGYWWPTGGSKMGCVVGDTKKHLGVSKEALELMRDIEVGPDDVGDISWWWCADKTCGFSWWGPIYRIIDPDTAVSARGFAISNNPHVFDGQYIEIPNDVPRDVVEAIENCGGDDATWREPLSIERQNDKEDTA